MECLQDFHSKLIQRKNIIFMSTVAEHSSQHPKFKGLSPAAAADTGKEKFYIICIMLFNLSKSKGRVEGAS